MSNQALEQLLQRFKEAAAYRLRYVRVKGGGKTVHICVYSKEITGGKPAYNLCGFACEKSNRQTGVHFSHKVVCRECVERLGILARTIANSHKQDLWALSRGESFTLTNAEVRAALELPNIWGEFTQQAPQPVLLPDEFPPKGSGTPIKRGWQ